MVWKTLRARWPVVPIVMIPVLLIAALAAADVAADDWYRWRGPALNGISSETQWRDRWPEQGPPIAWRASVGTGYSSVSVSDGRLYTMGNRDNRDIVYCLDAANGEEIWRHSYRCPLEARFFEGGPTSTPTVDGHRVYTLSRQGDLFCFGAAEGEVLWSKNIADETEVRIPGWGFAASPLVHGNLLLLNVGQAGTAVEKTTGELVWKSADGDAGYATPLPIHRDGRWLAVVGSAKFFMAVDIQSGQVLWRHRWLTRFGANAADAIVSGDRLFISSGYNRGAALLDISAAEPSEVWTSKEMQTQMNGCVLIDGFLYGFDGNTTSQASIKCLELSTGQVQWTELQEGVGSLTAADGKLIVLSEAGELIVAPASPRAFLPTARANVIGGTCWTVPVLSGGRIYCRNADGDLVCVDVRAARGDRFVDGGRRQIDRVERTRRTDRRARFATGLSPHRPCQRNRRHVLDGAGALGWKNLLPQRGRRFGLRRGARGRVTLRRKTP